MTYFWILAAVMVMVALGIILPPLLGRSQHATVSRRALNLAVFQERMDDLELEHRQGKLSAEELVQVRSEVERELIYDLEEPAETQQNTLHPVRAGALAVGIIVPLLSVLLYLQLGNREALQLTSSGADAGNSRESAVHPGQKPGQEMPSLDEMIAGLTSRLESEPDNLQGWIMLGRSYQVMERFEESKEAFAQAYALAGDDPEVLARYAESIALSQRGRLAGKPSELLAKVLKIQPENSHALWLSGLAARQIGDYRLAITHLEKLQELAGPEDMEMLSQQIAEVRAEMEKSVDGAPPTKTP